MLAVLAAPGPFPAYADELVVFGRLVGSWDIDDTHFNADGSIRVVRRGEWHFGWVLEGRVIQDVLISPPLEERAGTGAATHEYGTTVRAYDPRIGGWRVTYIAPVFGATVNLIARERDDEIVLEGRGPDGKLNRWVFSEITDEYFRWRGYESSDEGLTWFMDEEMHARRRPAALSPAARRAPASHDPA
jgi:hypothetical protein